jgi:site-specific recombinase XerD
VARESVMSAPVSLQDRVENYLAERRRLGFALHSWDSLLTDFATFVADRHHDGPLTVELMVAWVQQGKGGQGTRETWYRRMAKLRLFLRYLQQFEPQTEIPEDTLFGPEPGRLAPHIYREEEIVELLDAARELGPRGCLRAATFETFMTATGCGSRRTAVTPGLVSGRRGQSSKSWISPAGRVSARNWPTGRRSWHHWSHLSPN